MTPDEILKLAPGPELDALVAEAVMGWAKIASTRYPDSLTGKLRAWGWRGTTGGCRTLVPLYSTDISAAVEVMEKLGDRMWYFAKLPQTGCWEAAFIDQMPSPVVEAKNLPEAICKAALLAVEGETP